MEEQNTTLAVASSCLFFIVIFVEETHLLFASEGTEKFHSQETYYLCILQLYIEHFGMKNIAQGQLVLIKKHTLTRGGNNQKVDKGNRNEMIILDYFVLKCCVEG